MKKLMIVLSVVLVWGACGKDESSPSGGNNGGTNSIDCSSVPKTFNGDVLPIIIATCTASTCHGSGSGNGPGALLNYAQINAAKVNIKSTVSSGTMPKEGKLTTAEKNTIICWVEAGAPNN